MLEIRGVIFDLYSTLIDVQTDEGKEEVFNYLSSYMQYYGARMGGQQLKSAFELERKRQFESSSECHPEVDLQTVFETILRKEGLNNVFLAESCCKLFRALSRERFELFPDTLPVLREMKSSGYLLAIVSDAQKAFSLDEARMLALDQFFDRIVVSTYFGFTKPDPRLFSVACALLPVPPANGVYIGNDPEADIKGAKRIGMHAILLSRNPRDRVLDVEPDFQASNLWDAWEWIKKGGELTRFQVG